MIIPPITFTDQENSFLQTVVNTMYQDDEVRTYEGPLILSILTLLEAYPTPPVFTEQQTRRLQVMLETFIEAATPYPYPYYPTTFGQTTTQLVICHSVLAKVQAAQAV
jgi:hypothetical protein